MYYYKIINSNKETIIMGMENKLPKIEHKNRKLIKLTEKEYNLELINFLKK